MEQELVQRIAVARAAAFRALINQRMTYVAEGRTRFDAVMAQLWIEDQLNRIGETYQQVSDQRDIDAIVATEMTLAFVRLETLGHVEWKDLDYEALVSHGGTDQKEGEQDAGSN